MNEKQCVVPNGMLEAAINYTVLPDGWDVETVETILRRGLNYQSENPPVPTTVDMHKLYKDCKQAPYEMILEWIRRAYKEAEERS